MIRHRIRSAFRVLAAAVLLVATPARAEGGEPPAWLRARIEAWVLAHLPDEPVHVSLPPFASDWVPQELDPAGVEVRIEGPSEEPLRGRVALALALERDGRTLARGEAEVVVQVLARELVATRTLERGERVAEGDLELRPLAPGARLRGRPLEPAAIVGKRTRRRVPRGAAWREEWVEAAPLVTRGQPVRLRYASGGLRIEATGVAREEGGAGDLVRVQNPASRRELRGRVAPDGSVHVAF
jgi:flagella basal body P-ring formation protein FlgA